MLTYPDLLLLSKATHCTDDRSEAGRSDIKLIVGLGNPGERYRLTRHNIGFEVVDLFCQELTERTDEHYQDFSIIVRGQINGSHLILAKPQTFMNLSGKSVSALVNSYAIPIENLCVVYDDLDLKLGSLRIRRGGSSGGHKGLNSIIEALGTQAFPRLRIGIGKLPEGVNAIDFVLSEFSEEERREIEKVKVIAVQALKTMIVEGIDVAMNRYNSRQKDDQTKI